MRTRLNKIKKTILVFFVVYIVVGFIYGMSGEVRLAVEYGGSWLEAFLDPYAYLRAAVFSPFWPNDLFWTRYHCGNLFGCPIYK